MNSMICPYCESKNDTGASVCKSCGIPLSQRAIVVHPAGQLNRASRPLPAKQLKRLGASIVISAAMLLTELSIIYLRRRIRYAELPRFIPRRKDKLPVKVEEKPARPATSGKRVVSVYNERVVEERRWGRPVRRIVNRMAWRSEETIES